MCVRLPLLLCGVVLLTACGPKFNYLNTRVEQPRYDHVLVVFDYLHVVDDVGKILDYPADKNQRQMAQLKIAIESMLTAKGFEGTVDFALMSSGLGLSPDMGFEHYVNGQLQDALVYPPFYLESPYHEAFQHQLIQSFADAQGVAYATVSEKNQGFFTDLRMNTLSFFASDDYFSPQIRPDSSVAVLHVRAIMPRVSFMKAMGVSLGELMISSTGALGW